MKRNVKRIMTIMLAILLLMLTSCSQTPTKKEIVGVWKCEDAQKMLDGLLGIISFPSGLLNIDLTLEFREDNTYEIRGSAGVLFYVEDIPTTVGTYTYENGELYIDGTKVDGVKISGKKLTIDSKDSSGRTIRIPFKKQD